MIPASWPNRSRTPCRPVGSSEDLAQEVARLSTLDTAALRQAWMDLFGADRSPRLGRSLMVRAHAYRLQERTLGALKPATQRLLDRIEKGHSGIAQELIPKGRTSAGTVLIREWRGDSNRVTVLDHDVVYRGQRYKSLSEVARVITGTR